MLEEKLEPDVRARVIGIKAQWNFLSILGVTANELVLSHGDNLSAVLHNISMSAHSIFKSFWEVVLKKAADFFAAHRLKSYLRSMSRLKWPFTPRSQGQNQSNVGRGIGQCVYQQ